jgi:hypothetical protein
MQRPVLNTEGMLASLMILLFLEGGTCPSGLDVGICEAIEQGEAYPSGSPH